MSEQLKFGVAILAAGASSRMGQPKLLLPWGNTTIVGHLIQTWKELGAAQLGVVSAPNNDNLQAELDRMNYPILRIVNAEPERGMFSSIQTAARYANWDKELSHFVLTLGDQPHLRRETLEAILSFAGKTPTYIVQPSYQERRKHPVIFPQNLWQELALTNVQTLREFLQLHHPAVRTMEFADPGMALDIDTPADYQRSLEIHLNSRKQC
jgi:molybdenum cofactor cytidylyltransferase